MRYQMGDGDMIEGQNYSQLVQMMHKQSREQADDDQSFMYQVAHRAKLVTGQAVRTDSAENFITDLAKSGLIERKD